MAAKKPRVDLGFPDDIIDTHIHLSRHYSGGLTNDWHPGEAKGFQRDWTEKDYLDSISKSSLKVKAAVFVECFNRPPVEEAKWVLKMIDDPDSVVAALTAQIECQKGAAEVANFLDQLRSADGALPDGLKGARMVFPACTNKAADCCMEPKFLEGLEELGKNGLLWEFCVHPYMAPCVHECISKFPNMTFIIDHLAHNGNEGGEMEKWGPAIDAMGKCPNAYAKMGATEEWGVPNPGDYMDRAIAAFGFDRILYESNWFVSEAMGDSYDTTAKLLLAACNRAGATESDLQNVFRGNAIRAYGLGKELQVCDAHMHIWDQLEKVSKFNNQILGECGSYLPESYRADLQLSGGRLKLRSCVHVEAFPTDQVEETRWVASLKNAQFPLGALVVNANISLQKENDKSTSTQAEGMEALEKVLKLHKATSGLVRGVRWVLNHEPNWPQVHRGDYFTDPQFREGYKKLEEHGLSYDLQCNPHQLADAASFMKDFPGVPVCLNHVGCLKFEGEDAARGDWLNSQVGKMWRDGMRALAALPHVECKLSMICYVVPNWWTSEEGKQEAKEVVLETIKIFGANRCMFASNFPAEDEPCRATLYANFQWMVKDMSAGEQEGLFFRNAERFYKIEPATASTTF